MARVHAAGSMDELHRLYNSVHKFLIITGVGLSAILCALSKRSCSCFSDMPSGGRDFLQDACADNGMSFCPVAAEPVPDGHRGQSLNTLSIFIALVINILLGIASYRGSAMLGRAAHDDRLPGADVHQRVVRDAFGNDDRSLARDSQDDLRGVVVYLAGAFVTCTALS